LASVHAGNTRTQFQLIVHPACIFHHPRGMPMIEQLASHEFHIRNDMMKELVVRRAEIVESRLAVGRSHEAMLRTLSIAGKTNVTLAAELGQRIALGIAEVVLLLRCN